MFNSNDIVGPYTLIRPLGNGAFGIVWLAERRTPITTTQFALKTALNEQWDIAAVRREAELWVRAGGHPNVVPIFEANVYNNNIVIVSEYMPDGSLEKRLRQFGGAMPTVEHAVKMMEGILAGLEHLHARRILHRDLKPANILLQGETPRLADFGISCMLDSVGHKGTMSGTPSYMSPETFRGERSEQTDVWSAGVILYQLLCGKLPFVQRDLPALMTEIAMQEPPPLPETVSIAIRIVVARALEKIPELRFKSAFQMRCALLDALNRKDKQALMIGFNNPTVTDFQSRSNTDCTNTWILHDTQTKPSIFIRLSIFFIVIGTGILFLILLSYLISNEYNKSSLVQTSSLSIPLKAKEILEYRLRVSDRKGKPFVASGREIYRSGDKFKFLIRTKKAGFLYIFNVSPDNNLVFLFPPPYVETKNAAINEDEELSIPSEWFQFDMNSGIENLVVVFSSQPVSVLDRQYREGKVNPNGIIDKMEAANIQSWFKANEKPVNQQNLDLETILSATDDPVVTHIILQHR